MDRISLSFAISDNYAQHLAVVLVSILESNPDEEFVFHVLHHSVTAASEAKVKLVEHDYPHAKVEFHKVDEKRFSVLPMSPGLEHVTRETYYRFILPEILSDEDRTIYSDVDVLCVDKIRELWETPLGDNLIAAQPEEKFSLPAFEPYRHRIGLDDSAICCYAGLLVMDLKRLREGNYSKILFDNTISMAGKLAWLDQDVINYTFQGRILPLSPLWNWTRKYEFINRRGVKIWHFPGALAKPWCNIWKNVTWIPYLKYLRKSPYRDQVFKFVMGHVKGFFYFSYTKKQVKRVLICGILVYKRKFNG